MQRLRSGEYVHLTERVLKIFFQNRICTVLEFLQEDAEKLATLTKLSLPQVVDVRNDILGKISAPLINGTSLLMNSVTKRALISSGIQGLDSTLAGGIPTGSITELCGLADSGKTQLCLQIAINCVKSSEDSILYVDTKGDFSANRIQKILDACGHSYKDMARIMFKIKVVRIWTLDELLALFKKLKNKTIVIKNLCLIIIDSLPCLMLQYLGDDNKIGLTFLNTLVNYSRFLSKEMNLALICVNIQTRWMDQDILDNDDDGEQSTSIKESYTEKRTRCLGNYWQLIPATIVLMEKAQNRISKENFTQLNVSVVKLKSVKCYNKCVLKVSNLGVR